jgi:hypothetical protein
MHPKEAELAAFPAQIAFSSVSEKWGSWSEQLPYRDFHPLRKSGLETFERLSPNEMPQAQDPWQNPLMPSH